MNIYPYIKVNKKVVDFLGVTNDRYQFEDGNYMLWKFDLLPLGGNNDDTLRMIGGVGMSSEQARDEQLGVTVTPLPEAEDERFRMDENEIMEAQAEAEPAAEENAEEVEEEEVPAEVAEEEEDESDGGEDVTDE